MRTCKVCGREKSPYYMNNRLVCLKCDELLFDVEIECDDDVVKDPKQPTNDPKKLRVSTKTNQKQ